MNMERKKLSGSVDRMTKFERTIVFRVARGYFFVMAIGAVLLFLGGVVLGARSLAKSEVPRPAPARAVPERTPLTYAAVLAQMQRAVARVATGSTVQVEGQAGEPKGRAQSEDPELEAASKELRGAFPDPPFSWEDEVEKTCTVPTSFGCLQYGTRIKRQGVVSTLSAALRGTPRHELVGYIRILARVLKEAPVEKRLEIAPAVISAEREAREEHEALVSKHQRQSRDAEERYTAEVQLNDAKYREWRQFAIYGVAAGFVLLIVVSLFLAFLSMERHTRALEQVAALLSASAPKTPRDEPA
jgi:hypothetical protein